MQLELASRYQIFSSRCSRQSTQCVRFACIASSSVGLQVCSSCLYQPGCMCLHNHSISGAHLNAVWSICVCLVSGCWQSPSDSKGCPFCAEIMCQAAPACCEQVTSQSELHQHAQKYNSQLQEYNGKLQDDLRVAAEQLHQLQVGHLLPSLPSFGVMPMRPVAFVPMRRVITS